jgi:thymidylate synthase
LVDNNCHIWDGDAYKNYINNPDYKAESVADLISSQAGQLVKCSTQEEFVEKIKTDDEFAEKWGDLGPVYGKQWREWKQFIPYDVTSENCKVAVKITDQIANLIHDLKTNPDSRRIIVSAWNVGEIDQMTLPPCHNFFQFYTRELRPRQRTEVAQRMGITLLEGSKSSKEWDKECDEKNVPKRAISLMWNQRSCDVPLGIPFNIASYGLLLEIIAKMVNMVPDELIGNLGDCHIYSNQIDGVNEQIGRPYTLEERTEMLKNSMGESEYKNAISHIAAFNSGLSKYYETYKVPIRTREPFELPTLTMSNQINFNEGIDEFLNSCLISDFIIEGYKSHPTIKFPLSN